MEISSKNVGSDGLVTQQSDCSLPNREQVLQVKTLVILPGLDGTDVFFRPLLAVLPESVRARIIQFPPSGANEYPDLLALVRKALVKTPSCYVLGWSFSGPLALMLAAAEPAKVRGVILASTFVRPPRRIFKQLRWVAVTPTVWMIRVGKRLPVWLSRSSTDRLKQDKTETWKRVSARMIAARVRTLLNVDARALLRDCSHRVLCLAGSHDGIVPYHNVEEMVRVQQTIRVCLIAGGHFAIYTNPMEAAAAITDFMDSEER
jgi:pimeloyl-ACP methyl ester carboxylesterase